MLLWLRELIHLGTFIITLQGLYDDLILSCMQTNTQLNKNKNKKILCYSDTFHLHEVFWTLDEGTHIDH